MGTADAGTTLPGATHAGGLMALGIPMAKIASFMPARRGPGAVAGLADAAEASQLASHEQIVPAYKGIPFASE